jgi:hypothetical protein
MSWLILLAPAVLAADADLFGVTDLENFDCDDNDSAINPGAQEIIGNLVDEDCDGHDALERFYVDSSFFAWPSTPGVSYTPDRVIVPNTGASLTRTISVPASRGDIHGAVKASSVVGAGCSLEVQVTSDVGTTYDTLPILNGTNVVKALNASASALPGSRSITRLKLQCAAGSSMQVDWVSIQNADAVRFPPSPDVQVTWEDLDVTGGGQHNAVRAAESGDFLIAGAQGGGVATWDLTTGTGWALASGKGPTGIPSHQRYVADVAAVNWDNTPGMHELFALSGKTDNFDTIGGLWHSVDEGAHWMALSDSYGAEGRLAPAYDDDSIDCYEGFPADGGGLKLLPDEQNEVMYVATHREHNTHGSSTAAVNGILLWDQNAPGMCELDFDLPVDEQVSALAMIEGLVDGTPMLLVGYRSPGAYTPGLYACDAGDAFGGPDLTCLSSGTIECAPVEGTERWDVRDIEVHPGTGRIYVATGGADPDDCMFDDGQVYAVDIDAFDTDLVLSGYVELTTSLSGFPLLYDAVPGLSIDPSERYLYATVPGTEEGIMRLDLLDETTPVWERMGENNTERPTKRGNMDVGTGWLGGTELEREIYVPEVRDTEKPIDLTWYIEASGLEDLPQTDAREDLIEHGVVYGWHTIWDVEGLDVATNAPITSFWTLTPLVDNTVHDTWATVGPVDIEPDADGNVWMAVPEQHGFMSRSWKDTYPQGGHSDGRDYGAERSCLIERYGGDGTSVSVGIDGSVWFSLAQSSGELPPHEMGIWKRLVEYSALAGWVTNYSFQGAAVRQEWERATHEEFGEFNDVLCEWPSEDGGNEAYDLDEYAGPLATALGTRADTEAEPNGLLFSDHMLDAGQPSWGNPRAVAALDSMIAVAAFASYGSVEGRLAYTLDGGNTWETIPYQSPDKFDYSCGTMADFFDDSLSLTLLKRGTTSHWEDDGDGVAEITEWALDIMVGSSGNTDECMMAHIEFAGNPTWEWYDNQPAELDAGDCRVTRAGFDGLTGTNWSNEIFFWGGYSAEDTGLNANGWSEYGGVCALDLNTGTITSVISPTPNDHAFEYQFADVAPSPNVADLLLVTGRQTPASVKECMEPIGTGPMSGSLCPNATPPLLVTRGYTGNWIKTPLGDVPGSDAGLAAAWGTGEVDDTIYLSTENSGAWKGRFWW